ncbi:hypothetical protein B0H13DRAFT_1879270 [Mycena leptocephala]|nr:hypothetical protein B0H13DRAFT_1879270 [Mycena leptocephala]
MSLALQQWDGTLGFGVKAVTCLIELDDRYVTNIPSPRRIQLQHVNWLGCEDSSTGMGDGIMHYAWTVELTAAQVRGRKAQSSTDQGIKRRNPGMHDPGSMQVLSEVNSSLQQRLPLDPWRDMGSGSDVEGSAQARRPSRAEPDTGLWRAQGSGLRNARPARPGKPGPRSIYLQGALALKAPSSRMAEVKDVGLGTKQERKQDWRWKDRLDGLG